MKALLRQWSGLTFSFVSFFGSVTHYSIFLFTLFFFNTMYCMTNYACIHKLYVYLVLPGCR